ncbi:alanine racemase [Actinoalloteichus caeruleus]|uniref:alanine racemase n=1 Tax=Actinoalloteichus cyanogriseus TaxID=2893586 RepID=UPI0004AA5FBE|nr:alanine racemase [Actinoalloteichus caeruleus]
MTSWTARGGLAEATVDLDAIAHNTALLAARATAPVLAVVKADAFGHGMLPVTRTVLDAGATWLGVATNAEALRLREAGVTAPVLSWLHAHDEDFDAAILAGVDLGVSSAEHLERIAECATRVGARAAVHLKVDTGLRRGGADHTAWRALLDRAAWLQRRGRLLVRGVWSHLGAAGAPAASPPVGTQVRAFELALREARDAGLDPELRHLANSAATLTEPATHYDLVRVGIALYGVEPVAGRSGGLRPAMTLRSRTVLVKKVPAGEGVSYEHRYRTSGESTLALVPVGFADGVPRLASNRGAALLAGRRRPVAGLVAMDQLVLDLGRDEANLGDEVLVLGPGDDGEPTAAEWAAWAETNPHEVLTGIGARIPRRYLGGARATRELEELSLV